MASSIAAAPSAGRVPFPSSPSPVSEEHAESSHAHDPWREQSLVIGTIDMLDEPATSSSVSFGGHLADVDFRRRLLQNDSPPELPREIVVYPGSDATAGRKGKERAVFAPMAITVVAAIMETSNGRDKILKCAQYSLRTYLYLIGLVSRVRALSPRQMKHAAALKGTVSGLSLTRKCLLLLNPLHPLDHLLSPNPLPAREMLGHLLELASALSDDIFCLYRLGVVSRRWGQWADKWANRLWLFSTLINLYKLEMFAMPKLMSAVLPSALREQRELRRTPEEAALADAKQTRFKLLCDLVFVSYDVFNLSAFKEPVQCVAGLSAAVISTRKLFCKHSAKLTRFPS